MNRARKHTGVLITSIKESIQKKQKRTFPKEWAWTYKLMIPFRKGVLRSRGLLLFWVKSHQKLADG